MYKSAVLLFLLSGLTAASQDTIITAPAPKKEPDYIWVFSSPRLINANTVEMIPKGILEFKITHNFGDIAGDNGGIKNFFGLDNTTDVRVGFQYGVSKNFNLIAARAKGQNLVRQLFELGAKYRFMQQAINDPKRPLTLSMFANVVVSTVEANPVPDQENSYEDFSDRLSQVVQVLVARKFGKVSLQVNPTLVHTNYVVPDDQNTLFAMGGAIRVPVQGRFSIIADYFHTFRNQTSIDSFKSRGIRFYDALGIGVEFLTEGHVFHLNFTNATEILENRFIPRTNTAWSKGQFRWCFNFSRDFDLFYKKKSRAKK